MAPDKPTSKQKQMKKPKAGSGKNTGKSATDKATLRKVTTAKTTTVANLIAALKLAAKPAPKGATGSAKAGPMVTLSAKTVNEIKTLVQASRASGSKKGRQIMTATDDACDPFCFLDECPPECRRR